MQRKFIREEPDEARAQRAMYDHFKIWTRRIYPTGQLIKSMYSMAFVNLFFVCVEKVM